MLYTCRVPNNTIYTPTAPFMARGLNLAPAKLGDIELFARPNHAQVAYSAYKDNIEAFLYATATGNKVLVGVKNYPFPDHYVPTLPLPLPKTVFAIDGAKRLAPSTRTALEAAMVKMKGELRDLQGKTGMVYLINAPIFSAIRTTLPALAPKTIPYISGYASIHATQAITTVYQGIEAFLATQTYEYKGEVGQVYTNDHLALHFPNGTAYIAKPEHFQNLPRKKYVSIYFRGNPILTRLRARITGKGKAAKVTVVDDEDAMEDDLVDVVDPEFEVFHDTTKINATAKPSPIPASSNFGGPEQVPYKDGLLFPYFPGMLIPDFRQFKDDVISLFFDNIPDHGSRFDAWKRFRTTIPSFVETEEGQCVQHIVSGLKLALFAQARPFLLFDKATYLGYVLLGSHFTVTKDGTTHHPLEASALREELAKIQSIKKTIQDIVLCLEKLHISTSDLEDEESNPLFVQMVAKCLEKVNEKTESEDEKAIVAELSRLMGNWVSSFQYTKISPKTVLDTFRLLTSNPHAPKIESRIEYFIPPRGWKDVGKDEYMYLARHGSSSISLRNAKGDEYRLNPLTSAYKLREKPKKGEEASKEPQRFVFCYEKPTGKCYADWLVVKQKGSIRQDGRERAAPQRATVIRDPVDVQSWYDIFSFAVEQFPSEDKDSNARVETRPLKEGVADVAEGDDGLVYASFDF